MITEAILCAAAARSSELYTAELQSSCDGEQAHVFSLQFERKIKKLKRRAAHPLVYRAARRIASVFLALFLCAGAWLAVDTEARAAVFGWVRELYESLFVYRFEGKTNPDIPPVGFRPAWLPDGYTEFIVDDRAGTTMVIYVNDAGEMLKFNYAQNPDLTDWFVFTDDVSRSETTVNGYAAELFISESPDIASAILWTTPDHTAFYISGFLPEADLIRFAESVEKKEK